MKKFISSTEGILIISGLCCTFASLHSKYYHDIGITVGVVWVISVILLITIRYFIEILYRFFIKKVTIKNTKRKRVKIYEKV